MTPIVRKHLIKTFLFTLIMLCGLSIMSLSPFHFALTYLHTTGFSWIGILPEQGPASAHAGTLTIGKGHAFHTDSLAIINGPNSKQIALLRWYNALNSNANFEASGGAGTVVATGIAFDGTDMWVSSFGGGQSILDVFKTSTGEIPYTVNLFTINQGLSFPNALAYDGKRMWVACRNSHKVYILEGSTGSLITGGEITVGTQPVYLAFDGKQMWVSNNGSSTLNVINVNTLALQTLSGNNLENPYGLAFDGSRMWVVNRYGTKADVYATSSNTHVMGPSQGANSLDIAFDGVNMWITNFLQNQITILRASDGALMKTLTTSDGVGDKPTYLAFDGRHMWVTNESDNTVSIFRVSDFTHVEDVNVGTGPQRIAFDGANVWITANDGRVYKR